MSSAQAGIVLSLATVATMAEPQSDADIAERLRDCARTEQVENRMECLQALANEAILEDNAPPEVLAAKRSPTTAESTDHGDEKAVIAELREASITGVLATCRRSATGAYLFYLEDGQIWKQVDIHRKRFKNCDWPVTIAKADDGYRLMLDVDDYVIVRRLK
jgi:hypothetical protein